jgi:2-beta-glucuronyltransferase
MGRGRRERAILFTQQSLGLEARKTSMIFLAEALAAAGYDVSVVTVQLSWLTRIMNGKRFHSIPKERRNRWSGTAGLRNFIWIAPVHPARTGFGWLDHLTGTLVPAYGKFLPKPVRETIESADLVIIESCAAVALFTEIRRLNREAVTVYSMSDRLNAVGMHPALSTILARDIKDYDLIRVPAASMLSDFPGANVALVHHGLDKASFDRLSPSPYLGAAKNAVLAGDMMVDFPLLHRLASDHAQVNFHCFGRSFPPLKGASPNLILHGEVPFTRLIPFIQHADVGLALYRWQPDLDYLAQSSLKNLQYAYCGLPIVGPHFVTDHLPRGYGYDPGDLESAVTAFGAALEASPGNFDPKCPIAIRDWGDVAAEIVARATRAHRAGKGSQAAAGADLRSLRVWNPCAPDIIAHP